MTNAFERISSTPLPWEEQGEAWVFAYGSLLWRPGFAPREIRRARIHGYRRAFCVYSHVHRGTPDRPGLVLGLQPSDDAEEACHGLAYRVAPEERDGVLAYLRERELVTNVYREVVVPALCDAATVSALTYVCDESHAQYARALDAEIVERLVRQGRGQSGANIDYVMQTAARLRELEIEDPAIDGLARRLCA